MLILVFLLSRHYAAAATMPQVQWTQQVEDTYGYSVTTDAAGNAYISGQNAAAPGAFLAKFDSGGALVWERQWSTSFTNPMQLTSDGLGNIYIVGQYVPPSFARSYAMLTKFDDAGNFQWMQQLGLADTSEGNCISADALGNVFIGGRLATPTSPGSSSYDYDGFVGRFDAAGNEQWIKRISSSSYDEVAAVASDQQGNTYFAGNTQGNVYGSNIGDTDVVVGEMDGNGNTMWAQQFGAAKSVISSSLAVAPGGKVYLAGGTSADLAGDVTPFDGDGYLRRYDAAGNVIWTRQFTLEDGSSASGIAADAAGNIYFVGGVLPSLYNSEVLVGKYDELGSLQWTKTFGTDFNDDARGISVRDSHGIYVGGYSWNSHSPYQTGAFVSKLVEVPEPATHIPLAIAMLTIGPACLSRRSR